MARRVKSKAVYKTARFNPIHREDAIVLEIIANWEREDYTFKARNGQQRWYRARSPPIRLSRSSYKA